MILLARRSIVSLTRQHYSVPLQTLLFSSSSKVSVPTADYLITQHHISPETALKASTISHLKNPLRTNLILSCLRQTGFSLPQIDLMINKYPKILNASPEVLKEKLMMFEAKGFSTVDTIQIVTKNPQLLHRSLKNRLVPLIDALKAILGSTDKLGIVLKRLPWFLSMDLSKNMIPNMELLNKRSQLSLSQVVEYLIWCPRLFCLQPEIIEDGLRRLDEMGLKWTPKMYIHALRVVSLFSDDKLKLKMRFFQGLGLSENEVLQMFRRCPFIFACAEKNLNETMEVLLGSGRADLSLYLTTPELLMYSLEKRIKPRLEVVKALEERGMWPKKLSLSTILMMSNKKFLERFVLSNSNALGDGCVIGFAKKLAIDSPV